MFRFRSRVEVSGERPIQLEDLYTKGNKSKRETRPPIRIRGEEFTARETTILGHKDSIHSFVLKATPVTRGRVLKQLNFFSAGRRLEQEVMVGSMRLRGTRLPLRVAALSGEDKLSALRAHRCTRRRRAIHHGAYLSCPRRILGHPRPDRVRFGGAEHDGRAGCDLFGSDVIELGR